MSTDTATKFRLPGPIKDGFESTTTLFKKKQRALLHSRATAPAQVARPFLSLVFSRRPSRFASQPEAFREALAG